VRPEDLIGALLKGAVGGRGKKSRGAMRYLTGGRGSLINASTLLTAAGLAWGAYEAATQKGEAPGVPPPRPLPPSGGGPPPLPGAAPAIAPPGPVLPPQVLRVVRLTIAAARVDGRLTDEEREAILEKARSVGAEAVVQHEIHSPRPLAEIVAGVSDPATREQLYLLAFAVMRADESVSGAERIFLAQLAHALSLEPAATARLESEAATRIDEAARQEA
jgi:uncharacterized membrane protein YebE (DUF533 family)